MPLDHPLGSSRLPHSKNRLPHAFSVGMSTSKLIDSTVLLPHMLPHAVLFFLVPWEILVLLVGIRFLLLTSDLDCLKMNFIV